MHAARATFDATTARYGAQLIAEGQGHISVEWEKRGIWKGPFCQPSSYWTGPCWPRQRLESWAAGGLTFGGSKMWKYPRRRWLLQPTLRLGSPGPDQPHVMGLSQHHPFGLHGGMLTLGPKPSTAGWCKLLFCCCGAATMHRKNRSRRVSTYMPSNRINARC